MIFQLNSCPEIESNINVPVVQIKSETEESEIESSIDISMTQIKSEPEESEMESSRRIFKILFSIKN